MTDPLLGSPGVVVVRLCQRHVEAEREGAVRDWLKAEWQVCKRLVPDGAAPAGLQPDFEVSSQGIRNTTDPRDPWRILAFRAQEAGARTHQAFAFVLHDLVGTLTCLSSREHGRPLGDWAGLLVEWNRAHIAEGVTEVDECLPVPPICMGLTDAARSIDSNAIASALGWSTSSIWNDVSLPGVRVLDLRSRGGSAFIVVGPDENTVDAMAWWDARDGSSRPAPLVEGVAHAAKITLLATEIAANSGTLEGLVRNTRSNVGALLLLLERRNVDPEDIDAAFEDLAASQQQSGSLLDCIAGMQANAYTAAIARANLETLIPRAGGPRSDGPFGAAIADAATVEQQIQRDLDYARNAVARLEAVQQLVSARYEHEASRLARAQQRLNLAQTSFLAAVVAAFGAVGVLKLDKDANDLRAWTALALLTAATFGIPLLAAHLHERYRLIDKLAASFIGAAALIFVVGRIDDAAAPGWFVLASAPGALLGVALARALDRRVLGAPPARFIPDEAQKRHRPDPSRSRGVELRSQLRAAEIQPRRVKNRQERLLTEEERERALLLCDDAKTAQVTASHRAQWIDIERILEEADAVDGCFRVLLTRQQAQRLNLDV